jgi:uncharacterized cupin superfamily protein
MFAERTPSHPRHIVAKKFSAACERTHEVDTVVDACAGDGYVVMPDWRGMGRVLSRVQPTFFAFKNLVVMR